MSNEAQSGSTSILGLLGIVFIFLKLTNVISWSWWYVTLPFWGGLVIGLGVLSVLYLVSDFYRRY